MMTDFVESCCDFDSNGLFSPLLFPGYNPVQCAPAVPKANFVRDLSRNSVHIPTLFMLINATQPINRLS